MSSQPALRIYRDDGRDAPVDREIASDDGNSLPHPLLLVVFSAAMHLLVLAGASIAALFAVNNGVSASPVVTDHPLHTVFVALVLAQCGLCSVFCARSAWPLPPKVVGGSLVLLCLWLLLVGTMETTKQLPVAAGAWAAGLFLEAIVVWLAVMGLEMAVHYESAAARSRFGLFHLLIATTAMAVVFGVGRIVAGRYGFALAEVPEWGFFWHVQLAAVLNAALTVGLYSALRLPVRWRTRAAFCSAMVMAVGFAAPLLFVAVFNENTSLAEMRWLFGSEGMFLIATLVPLEVIADRYILK